MIITPPVALIHLFDVFLHFQPLSSASILSANLSWKCKLQCKKPARLPRAR
jgi:hypothetical protein